MITLVPHEYYIRGTNINGIGGLHGPKHPHKGKGLGSGTVGLGGALNCWGKQPKGYLGAKPLNTGIACVSGGLTLELPTFCINLWALIVFPENELSPSDLTFSRPYSFIGGSLNVSSKITRRLLTFAPGSWYPPGGKYCWQFGGLTIAQAGEKH